MRKSNLILALALSLITLGCEEPVKDYSYLNLNRIKGWEADTQLTLNFEMKDTISPCELYFVGEIASMKGGNSEGYRVNLIFISPDSLRYSDTITLPVNVKRGGGISRVSRGITEIEWPYRKNIYNKKPGEWRVILTKGDKNADYSDIVGIGIYCKQKKL